MLKVFDHRFSPQPRGNWEIPTWSVEREREYQWFVCGGRTDESSAKLDSSDGEDDEEDDDDGEGRNGDEDSDDENEEGSDEGSDEEDEPGKKEAFIYHKMQSWYRTEVEVYDTLKDLQRQHIPQLLATFTVPSPSFPFAEKEDGGSDESIKKHTSSSAILLQYIDGFPLKHITNHCPKETWQFTCEDAINIILLTTKKGILNEDVRTWNFIVRRDTFKVFMIDFASCEFRWEYESEENWAKCKAFLDEEGAVGVAMERYLKRDLFIGGLSCMKSWIRII